MLKKNNIAVICGALLLGACSQKMPAPVVNGYEKPAKQGQFPDLPPVENALGQTPEPGAMVQNLSEPGAEGKRTQEIVYQVQKGDRLEQIARHFEVDVESLMAANNIDFAEELRVGEVIVVPSNKYELTPEERTQLYRHSRRIMESSKYVPKYKVSDRTGDGEVTTPGVFDGAHTADPRDPDDLEYATHRVQRGETLYGIGQRYNVSPIDLMAVNRLEQPEDLLAGTVLRVPLNKVDVKRTADHDRRKVRKKGLIWPADGKLLRAFGHVSDGITNNGVKIGLPENTPIVAAGDGTVIYADDGLRSYGNLILIRHDDGLVTAYGHNAKNAVGRNEFVQRGQVIGYAGKTGNATEPQLHFEVRRNARPVNPNKVLPKRD